MLDQLFEPLRSRSPRTAQYAFARTTCNHVVVPGETQAMNHTLKSSVADILRNSSADSDQQRNLRLKLQASDQGRQVHVLNVHPLCDADEKIFGRINSSIVDFLRVSTGVVSLNLFPASTRDVQLNKLLHTAARTGEFDWTTAHSLTGASVLVLAIPSALMRLLSEISWEQLEQAQLEILALILDDSDDLVEAQVEDELEASMQVMLAGYLRSRSGRVNRKQPLLLKTVETLLVMCYRSSWKIGITCLHVRAEDVTFVRGHGAGEHGASTWRSGHHDDSERSPALSKRPSLRDSLSPRKSAAEMWSLFVRWPTFRDAVMGHLHVNGRLAADIFSNAHERGLYDQAESCAKFIIAWSRSGKSRHDSTSSFRNLPVEVIETNIAPYVLLYNCVA